MTGTIALVGGSPFVGNDDLDRTLLAGADAGSVVVLPTADAFEGPERLVAAARDWGGRLGVAVDARMVLRRPDAADESHVAAVAAARAIWLVGDSPLHLRSVLKDTPLWTAITAVVDAGGVVCGVGQSASALCDPMTDPRGGAFTLGLGLVPGVAFVAEAEQMSPDRLARTLKIADVPVLLAPSGAAVLRRSSGFEMVGEVTVHGDLPA